MNSLKTLLLLGLVAGFSASVLADEKEIVKDENEIVTTPADLADINLPGDEIDNPIVIGALDYSYGPADISTWNNIYSGTYLGYTFRAGDDVVFKYTPAVSVTGATIQTCIGTNFDTVIHLFQGYPVAGGRIGYNDDGCSTQSIISNVTFTAGIDYYIIVESYSASVAGQMFTLQVLNPCVDPGCPAGYDAAFELEANCAATNNTCATGEALLENTPLCGMTKADGTRDTDWFSVVLTDTMNVTLTVAANCVPMRAYFYSGTCASTTQRAYVTVAAGVTGTSPVATGMLPGTYFVKIEATGTTGFPCSGNYHYGLIVNSIPWVDPCTLYSCMPLVVSASQPYVQGNTAGKPNVSGNLAPDDYYCFTATYDCEVTFSTCNTYTAFAPTNDTYLRLFDSAGPCGGGVQIDYDDDSCDGLNGTPSAASVMTTALVGGMSYVLQVEGYSSNAGPYQLDIIGDCILVGAIETPTSFALGQNVPNPFNPTTTINYSLSETGVANLTVYDIAGRTVATLVDGMVVAGPHSVVFDASGLSSGVYFYTLQANGTVETRKMVLMK